MLWQIIFRFVKHILLCKRTQMQIYLKLRCPFRCWSWRLGFWCCVVGAQLSFAALTNLTMAFSFQGTTDSGSIVAVEAKPHISENKSEIMMQMLFKINLRWHSRCCYLILQKDSWELCFDLELHFLIILSVFLCLCFYVCFFFAHEDVLTDISR